MQESLLNTVKQMQTEQKVNVEELEVLLKSDIEEVVSLCKKACLKPKTDKMGNAYFTKEDVDMLKKMKALYVQSQSIKSRKASFKDTLQESQNNMNKAPENLDNKIEYLQKAKTRTKSGSVLTLNPTHPVTQLAHKLESLENNIVSRMGELLSEKMDGFDEIIVELVRAKTENENLRQQVNSLNKQIFILKNELASFNALPFGFYTKRETDD